MNALLTPPLSYHRRRIAAALVACWLAWGLPAGAAPDPMIGVSAQEQLDGSHRAQVERWAASLGKTLDDIGHIQQPLLASTWEELESGAVREWQSEANWRDFDEAFKARFELSVPMFPLQEGFTAGDAKMWAAAVKGDYDAHFRVLAQHLVEAGFGRAKLRLAWKFNGRDGSLPWQIQLGNAARQRTLAKHFVTCWQRLHRTMMAVPGAKFQWVWCPLVAANDHYDPSLAWPGPAFVDVVAADFHDAQSEYYGTDLKGLAQGRDRLLALSPRGRAARRQMVWDKLVRGRDFCLASAAFRHEPPSYRGLNWLHEFARKRGKKFGLSEWAIWPRYVGSADGGPPVFSTRDEAGRVAVFGYADSLEERDNPDFIARVHRWLRAHPTAYACYFDVRRTETRADHSLSPRSVGGVTASQHPRAAATYRQLFAPPPPGEGKSGS